MTESVAVGVDIGGTKIAFARVSRNGEVQEAYHIPTNPQDGVTNLLDRVAEGIRVVMADQPIVGIGLGCPGHVDSETVRNAVNLGWSEVPLRSAIQERMGGGIPVWLEKDANANTLGEMYYGAARNSRDFLYIAIGTGLGGGAVIDGRLLVGANAYATEVGHVSLDPTARECVCGLHGCPEIYIAGVGIMAGLREHAIAFPDSPLAKHPSPNTSLILQHAKAGDPLAHKIMDEARDWLIKTLAMYTTLLNPELIVIGGGMGLAARSYLIEGIEVVLKTRVLPATAEKLRVLEAGLTSSAVGAASLVWHALGT